MGSTGVTTSPIVRYDDAKGVWLIRNPWGTGWGHEGYGWWGWGQCGIADNLNLGAHRGATNPDT